MIYLWEKIKYQIKLTLQHMKVIWYEDFDDLPVLIEEVFALKANAHIETGELHMQTESKIKEIQNIENKIQESIGTSWSDEGVWRFLSLKDQYGERYLTFLNMLLS